MSSGRPTAPSVTNSPVNGINRPSIEAVASNISSAIAKLHGAASSETITDWQRSLSNALQASSRPPEITVGLVGMSGAGKSSLINALLGDHIVPTSCYDACTATPIHISYHDEEMVRARIDFVSAEVWLEDIQHLIEALRDVSGNVKSLNPDDTVIWQRIMTVYPQFSEGSVKQLQELGQLETITPGNILASNVSVAKKLGCTLGIQAPPASFDDRLQYQCRVDDKVALWPIIAQITIQCKAPILKGGLTLIDLPGELDSNIARAAIATEYMETCDHIFVVASIKRAVTDQIAQRLATERIKQLQHKKYNANSVAIIATSTDDVQVREIVSRFGLRKVDSWNELDSRLRSLEDNINRLCKEIKRLSSQPQGMLLQIPPIFPLSNHSLIRLAVNTQHPEAAFRDEGVSGPLNGAQTPAKRIGFPIDQPPPKRQRTNSGDASEGVAGTSTTPERSSSPSGRDIPRIISAKEDLDALKASRHDLANERKRYCIAVRSTNACQELQSHFKQGFSSLAENPDADPGLGDIRVFAASAYEYMKLRGKIPEGDDDAPPVFRTIEETGVPEVAGFLRLIVRETILKWKKHHSEALSAIVTQILCWIAVNTVGSRKDRAALEAAWDALNRTNQIGVSISQFAESASGKVLHELENGLAARMREAAAKPGKSIGEHFLQAIAALAKHYNTVKAILRRAGKWKEHDWNRALYDYLRHIFKDDWTRVLISVPSLDEDVCLLVAAIDAALSELEQPATFGILKHLTMQKNKTLGSVDAHARKAALKCRNAIAAQQKAIARQMLKTMASKMHDAYQTAYAFAGPGVREKAVKSVHNHLVEHGEIYFSAIVESAIADLRAAVEAALKDYCDSLGKLTGMIESRMKPTTVWENALAEIPFQKAAMAAKSELKFTMRLIEEYKASHE
ncbi:hypothetical protein AURDEDRAFT_161245 [Auricularia subglabra TFB-10046 SS5]|nr:hypothetical protein AURDEDRAFT_161245 [Auricularia subglabra TFB-10046 SS5]